ncbi:MAG: T9SS type A sorting domain-containing protein, partial [Bacteroidota bacterium]|nr:T9SS type A sorting domain-containing protein [Bacteroidota bacterium]
IYAGRHGAGVYHSADFGLTWTVGPEAWQATSLTVENEKIYASTFFGAVKVSVDDANTWQELYPDHISGYGRDLVSDGNEIWIARDDYGIFHSADSGLTWQNAGLIHTQNTHSLFLSDSIVFAGTDMGVWQIGRAVQPLTLIEHSKKMSVEIVPNPSSGLFNLQFETPLSGTVCIYDVLGNCILTQQFSSSLNQQISISENAKGVYFIEVNAGEKKYTQKLIIN